MARQVQTVLVSMLLHIVALFLIVVIPLLAMDGLPGIPSMTRYVPVEIKAPEMPAAPRPAVRATPVAVEAAGPPVVAPSEIKAEAPERPPVISNVPSADVAGGVPGAGNRVPIDTMNVAPPPKQMDPVRPGGQVKAPTRVRYAAPVYPAIAIGARISGTVVIEAVIGTDGSVRDARIVRSIPLLDDAALTAVRQWRYTPTTLNGIPVPVVMTVRVRFEIGG